MSMVRRTPANRRLSCSFKGSIEDGAFMRIHERRMAITWRRTAITLAIASAAIVATAGHSARAEVADATASANAAGAWYVNPMVQWWQLDKSRDAANHVAGQLGLGYSFDPTMAVEVEGGGASFAATCGCALTLKKLSVDLLLKFRPGGVFHPYVILGAGGIEDREDGLRKTTAAAIEGGGGVLFDFGTLGAGAGSWASGLQLRTEFKYQHEFHDLTATSGSVGDKVYGIGVQYSF